MKPQDDLFQLIASLSRAEKRYFKIYAGRHVIGKQNKYVQLFDLVDRQSSYDVGQIRKKYPGTNLSSDKNYLKKLILKSMRAYRDGGHIRTRLQELIEEAHFLKEKGLYEQCLRRLQKARSLALEYECHYQLLEILDLQRRLIKQNADSKLREKQNELIEEQEQTIRRIRSEMQFSHLYDRVFLLSRIGENNKNSWAPEDIELLQQAVPLLLPADESSTESRIQLHSSRALYFNQQRDYEQSYAEIACIVALYEAHPQAVEKNPDRYKIALSNLLVAAMGVNRYDEFPFVLEKIRELPTPSFDEAAETFQNLAFLELTYFLNTGQFDAIPHLAEQVDQGLDQYAAKINQARMHAICFNFSLGFLIREELRSALSWLGRILNHKAGDQRKDIQQASRILQLIIHLELGNADLIHSLLRSTRRYLSLRQGMRAYEKAVIDFFRKAIATPGGPATQELYKVTIKDLQALHADAQGHLLLCQEIILWLQARVNGQSLREGFKK